MSSHTNRIRVRMRDGWVDAGREGWALAPPVFVEQFWSPVLWDGEEDPDFVKTAGLTVPYKLTPELEAKVKAVVRWILSGQHSTCIDGGDIQSQLTEIGLLEVTTQTETCGEECVCAEYASEEWECYRTTRELREWLGDE